MKTLNKFFTTFLVALAFTFTTTISAQGGGNADGSYTGPTGNPTTTGPGSVGGNCGHGPNAHAGNATCNKKGDKIPLDGGLSILLAGAAAFGISRLRKK